jgi:hypothetical protein
MNGGVGEMIDDVPRWCKPAQNATSPSSVPSLITIVFDLVPGLESVSTCTGLPRAHSRRHGRLRLAASRPVDPNTLGAAVAVCHQVLTAVPISLLSRSHPPASRTGREPGSGSDRTRSDPRIPLPFAAGCRCGGCRVAVRLRVWLFIGSRGRLCSGSRLIK